MSYKSFLNFKNISPPPFSTSCYSSFLPCLNNGFLISFALVPFKMNDFVISLHYELH